MALSANIVWEIRQGGSANGSAGFNVNATGTDYSQQNSPQYSYTDLATNGATLNQVTSSAQSGTFTTALIGNLIYIASGTNFTAGYYEITAVSAGVATLDRNCATSTGSAGTAYIGGATSAMNLIAPSVVGSNLVWITGSFTTANSTWTNLAAVTPASNAPWTRFVGYGTTRGDSGRATFTAAANSIVAFQFAVGGIKVENMVVDGGNFTGTIGIYNSLSTAVFAIRNCFVKNCKTRGLQGGNGSAAIGCEVTNCPGTSSLTLGSNGVIDSCYVHDNGKVPSISSGVVINSIFSGNTGDGISVAGSATTLFLAEGNVFYNNTANGLNYTGTTYLNFVVRNNLFVGNGGYGIASSSAGFPAMPQMDGNGYYNNTSGTIDPNFRDAGTTNPTYKSAPYTNQYDVTNMTSSPLTNPPTDFSLNSLAGGGALVRGKAQPQQITGISGSTSYEDMGPYQHKDAATHFAY